VLRSGTQTLLVYHWYEGDAGLALEMIRSLLALDSSPLRQLDDILAVRMTTPIEGPLATGLEPAAAHLDGLYAALREAIDRLPGLRRARDGTAFLHFPIWVKLFYRAGLEISWNPESIQRLGNEVGLGTRLAREEACLSESMRSRRAGPVDRWRRVRGMSRCQNDDELGATANIVSNRSRNPSRTATKIGPGPEADVVG
jgi:hypothetical protein